VLDGGHIMFAIYEGVTRRTVNPKVLNWLVNAFAVLLLTFFVYISVRDTWLLARIFGKKPAAVENVMPGASTNAVPAAGEGVAPAAAEAP
jgi:hypothetical protein